MNKDAILLLFNFFWQNNISIGRLNTKNYATHRMAFLLQPNKEINIDKVFML